MITAIRTDGLTRRFGDLCAVDDLCVEIPGGGITGPVGPNGSGKQLSYRSAVALGLGYIIVAFGAVLVVFTRRDVTE
jgi:ABC-type uncharacterized transport system ATPase subunit